MRGRSHQRLFRLESMLGIVLSLTPNLASATSYIILASQRRTIIIAADTLVIKTHSESDHVGQALEKHCKIARLGNFGFVASGTTGYLKAGSGDSIRDWDTVVDARNAYKHNPNKPSAIVDAWAAITLNHFRTLYRVNPKRFGSIDSLILWGCFALFDSKGNPYVIEKKVVFKSKQASVEMETENVPIADGILVANNPITQELIATHPKVYFDRWQSEQIKINAKDRDWKLAEFFILTTADLDEHVGKMVDVLELYPKSKSRWIQNFTCPQSTALRQKLR